MQLLPHCFCLNLLVGRDRLILLCLNETVCYIRFNHLACTANITIMHNELFFVSPKLLETFGVLQILWLRNGQAQDSKLSHYPWRPGNRLMAFYFRSPAWEGLDFPLSWGTQISSWLAVSPSNETSKLVPRLWGQSSVLGVWRLGQKLLVSVFTS